MINEREQGIGNGQLLKLSHPQGGASLVGGFPTPVRTTGGTPASGWLDLRELALGFQPTSAIQGLFRPQFHSA
ncbi:hypothetical protein FDUTEX481_04733 [Tolypothrix sp. PCC 7601]|nr:hypothetical protein FDUTEX481_04733 [Tolypothrix sp. PCC 7601]BAY89288.1 hypothetical protein NIES3275_12910 [Microchaete diplosiphon NIES-3275]